MQFPSTRRVFNFRVRLYSSLGQFSQRGQILIASRGAYACSLFSSNRM